MGSAGLKQGISGPPAATFAFSPVTTTPQFPLSSELNPEDSDTATNIAISIETTSQITAENTIQDPDKISELIAEIQSSENQPSDKQVVAKKASTKKLKAEEAQLQQAAENPELVAAPASGFALFGLPQNLLEALERCGYQEPSPIQAAAIPELMLGRDLIGQAQTGTGKTAAFALPLLARHLPPENFTRAMLPWMVGKDTLEDPHPPFHALPPQPLCDGRANTTAHLRDSGGDDAGLRLPPLAPADPRTNLGHGWDRRHRHAPVPIRVSRGAHRWGEAASV